MLYVIFFADWIEEGQGNISLYSAQAMIDVKVLWM